MDINELEKAYQEVAFGYDEPDAMCVLGSSLRVLSKGEVTQDSAGNPIGDDKWYWVSKQGITEVL